MRIDRLVRVAQGAAAADALRKLAKTQDVKEAARMIRAAELHEKSAKLAT